MKRRVFEQSEIRPLWRRSSSADQWGSSSEDPFESPPLTKRNRVIP